MKRIAIQQAITGFDGNPLIEPTTGEPVKVKDILLVYAASYEAKEPKKAIRMRQLGQEIYDAKIDMFEIEDADLDLLQEAMKTPRHTALAMGIVYKTLEEAEEVKKNKEEEND